MKSFIEQYFDVFDPYKSNKRNNCKNFFVLKRTMNKSKNICSFLSVCPTSCISRAVILLLLCSMKQRKMLVFVKGQVV